MNHNPLKLIDQIISVLSPNLLHKNLLSKITKQSHKLFGFCYITSEALYHLYGKENDFKPYRVEFRDPNYGKVSHWYLKGGAIIIDITAGQFKCKVPYDQGKPAGFLTSEPSKRAKEIMRRLEVEL